MKVLLVSVNREEFPDPVYPLGVSLVAAAVEQAGHRVRIVDLRWDTLGLPHHIAEWAPDLVGLGIRNVDNLTWGRSVSYVPQIEAAVADIREVFRGPLVLGGSGYSLFPAALLDSVHADYGVVGEGEEAFPELLRALSEGGDLAQIPGVLLPGSCPAASRPESGAVPGRNPLRPTLVGRYAETKAAIGVQTKRGCAFRCTYCTYPALEGRSPRLRDPTDVVSEVEELVGGGAESIFFVDDTFNVPREHAEAVCRGLVERRVRVTWSAFLHPGRLPPRLAEWMKRSGCAGLEFGTDSLSDPVLEELSKGFTVAEAEASHRAAAETGIPVAHYLLLGSPGETPETLQESLETADRLPPAAYIAMLGVRLYPGTELTRRARAEGVIGEDQDLLEPAFYISPQVEAATIAEQLRTHARQRRNWIAPSLGIRSDPAVLSRVRLRRSGPAWGALLGKPSRI